MSSRFKYSEKSLVSLLKIIAFKRTINNLNQCFCFEIVDKKMIFQFFSGSRVPKTIFYIFEHIIIIRKLRSSWPFFYSSESNWDYENEKIQKTWKKFEKKFFTFSTFYFFSNPSLFYIIYVNWTFKEGSSRSLLEIL